MAVYVWMLRYLCFVVCLDCAICTMWSCGVPDIVIVLYDAVEFIDCGGGGREDENTE